MLASTDAVALAGHYTNFNLRCIYSLNCNRHAHSELERRIVAYQQLDLVDSGIQPGFSSQRAKPGRRRRSSRIPAGALALGPGEVYPPWGGRA